MVSPTDWSSPVPAQPPAHIILDRNGRQIDASSIIKQLCRIERLSDWSHPETQTQIDELAGKLRGDA